MAKNHDSQGTGEKTGTIRLVFSACWNELRETIGTAPTAVLLRRAVAMSIKDCPSLSKIEIEKNERDYSYDIPPEVDADPEVCSNIELFVQNILSLLQKLTGDVLVDQLLANPIIKKSAGKE